MYCHWKNHDFNDPVVLKNELRVVHAGHLLSRDASLHEVADLPIDMGAERIAPGGKWERYEDRDDD